MSAYDNPTIIRDDSAMIWAQALGSAGQSFTESFNISVSVAILLQTIRQRLELSDVSWKLTETEQIDLKIQWCEKILNGGKALSKEFRARYQKD